MGVNIAGFDFYVHTDGTFDASKLLPPLAGSYTDGVGQMKHFVDDNSYSMFRLPVGWQYLTNNKLGGPLDSNNFGMYDRLVRGCLGTGASCIIDIHNCTSSCPR